MLNLHKIGADEANRHFQAVTAMGMNRGHVTAIPYFKEMVGVIRLRLERESAMDPKGEEFVSILEASSCINRESYLVWLEGVLAYQMAYLYTLEHT